MKSRVPLMLVPVALLVAAELATWRTYSAHSWHRHYLWDASASEALVHVGIPFVVVSAIIVAVLSRARSRAKAARQDQRSDRSRHPLEESVNLRP